MPLEGYHDFGTRNSIATLDFGMKNGISCDDFGTKNVFLSSLWHKHE